METEKWIEDINQIKNELPKLHKNLFFSLKAEEFYQNIFELEKELNNLSDYEIRIEIAKLIAKIKDAHTSISLPITKLCPIEFFWFDEGIHIIDVADNYAECLYGRLTHVNDISIEDVIFELSKIISCENEAFLKALLPRYLPAIEILYDLYLVDNVDKLKLTCELSSGEVKAIEIDALTLTQANKKLQTKIESDKEELPMYKRYPQKSYWYAYLENEGVLYFKYNSCKNDIKLPIEGFCEELLEIIASRELKALVIDIRNNRGGDSSLLDTFIDELSSVIKQKKFKIYLIIGRDTFSSAMLNAYSIKEKTKAIILGEATGGKPNCYGEVQRLTLKNSKLVISYSTVYYEIIDDDEIMSLEPEVRFEFSIFDFIKKFDPCIDFVLKDI